MAITKVTSGVRDIATGEVVAGDLASTLDLSGKAVTLAAGAVTAHVTAFDDKDVRNDIATLALHSAVGANQVAHNLSNAFIDVFQDATGIATLTTCGRDSSGEYVSSIADDTNVLLLVHSDESSTGAGSFIDSSTYGRTLTAIGSPDHNIAVKKFGDSSIKMGGNNEAIKTAASSDFKIQGDFTVDMWIKFDRYNSDSEGLFGIGPSGSATGGENQYLNVANSATGGNNIGIGVAGSDVDTGTTFGTAGFYHIAVVRSGSGSNNVKFYVGGAQNAEFTSTGAMPSSGSADGIFYFGISGNRYMDGYIDEVRVTKDARWTANFTPATAPYTATSVNAAGNFVSAAQTALSTVSVMDVIVLYKNNAGTNTLNTDIICALSADGTNFQNVTLTAGGTFSTGILIAVANNVTMSNTGTTPKYKISFANQALGSKEARIHGVAILY